MSSLQERIAELCESGVGRKLADDLFLPLMTLDSGRDYGLDGEARWAMIDDQGGLVRFDEQSARHFVELLEHARREVEERLERRAAELELPVDDVVLAMPALELLAAMFGSPSPHFVRLALGWMLPSEIAALRGQLAEIAERSNLPLAVRDHARRLL
jgi:hypothetical protein